MRNTFFSLFVLFPFYTNAQIFDNEITDSIIIAFKSYDIDNAKLLIDKLKNEELKKVFLFQWNYYKKGEIRDNLLNKNKKLPNGRVRIINEYLLGDYYRKKKVSKNNESFKKKITLNDSLAYLYYKTAFIRAKGIQDTLLINEILPRISKLFFDYRRTNLDNLKEYYLQHEIYALDSIDKFWKSYYNIVIKLSDYYNQQVEQNLPKFDFNFPRSLVSSNSFLRAKMYQLEGVFNNFSVGNYEEAKFCFNESIELYEKNDFYLSKRGEYENRINLGNVYFNIKRYDKVISICEKEFTTNISKEDLNYLLDEEKICNLLIRTYEKLNNTSKLSFYSEKKSIINELIGKYSNASSFEIIDYEFKIIEKEEKLKNLEIRLEESEKENKKKTITNKSLKSKLLAILPILGGTLFLLIFIFYLYKRYKTKSTILEEEQSETLQRLDELKSIVIKNHIVLKDKTKVYITDLMYIKSDDHYLEIFTQDGKSHTVRGKLSQIKEELPPNFIQCHRSYIVNSNYIKQVNSTSLTLINKEQIPLSRSYKKKFNS